MLTKAIGMLCPCHRIAFTVKAGFGGPFRRIGYFSIHRSVLFQKSSLVKRFQSSTQTGKLPFEVETRVSQDVLLFKYENRRFFIILTFFTVTQFVFWSYLSHFSYTTLRDISRNEEEKNITASWKTKEEDDEDGSKKIQEENQEQEPTALVWWRRINFGENKYRIGISVLCASVGYFILAGSWLYTTRTVRTLTLLKGGHKVRVKCYTPWGRDRIIEVPLNDLTCEISRQQAKSHLPIKIRGYWMFFLLDKNGTYTNTKLFDYTAGLKRLWSKQK